MEKIIRDCAKEIVNLFWTTSEFSRVLCYAAACDKKARYYEELSLLNQELFNEWLTAENQNKDVLPAIEAGLCQIFEQTDNFALTRFRGLADLVVSDSDNVANRPFSEIRQAMRDTRKLIKLINLMQAASLEMQIRKMKS